MDHYTKEELVSILGSVGDNVKVDKSVRFINGKNITIGSDVRIDAYTIFVASEKISLGSNVHIAHSVHVSSGGGAVSIADFCGLSSRVSIFTGTDDYVEGWLTGPTVPDQFKKIKQGPVTIMKHVVVGAGSIVMPDIILEFGCTVGALSFVNKSVPELSVVAGVPAKLLLKRNGERLRELEAEYLKFKSGN